MEAENLARPSTAWMLCASLAPTSLNTFAFRKANFERVKRLPKLDTEGTVPPHISHFIYLVCEEFPQHSREYFIEFLGGHLSNSGVTHTSLLLPSQLYLDRSHCPCAHASYLAALPSTRAISQTRVFYVAHPIRSIPTERSNCAGLGAGSELVVLVFEQDVERGERSVTARDVLLQVELVGIA